MEEQTSGSDRTGTEEEDLRELAIRELRRKREFLDHLGWFIFINAVLWVIWAVNGADTDDIWPAWVTGIWGVFVVSQAWRVYRGPDGRPSEQQIQQEMQRLRDR